MQNTFVYYLSQDTHSPLLCVPAFAEATFHWPTSFARCAHSTKNTSSILLMLPIIGIS